MATITIHENKIAFIVKNNPPNIRHISNEIPKNSPIYQANHIYYTKVNNKF